MVFLIQNTQNRDSAALQPKIDELVRSGAAQNAFIGIEHLSQDEVDAFPRQMRRKRRQGQDERSRQQGGVESPQESQCREGEAHIKSRDDGVWTTTSYRSLTSVTAHDLVEIYVEAGS